MKPINLTITPRWETEKLPLGTRTGVNDPHRVYPKRSLFLGNLFVASYRLELISCHPPKTAYSATTGEVNGWNETEYHYFDLENDAITFCTEEMNKLIRSLEGKNE